MLILCHHFSIAPTFFFIKPRLLSSQYEWIQFQNALPFWSVPTKGSIDTFNHALISSSSSSHRHWLLSCARSSICSSLRLIASSPSRFENCEYCELGVEFIGVWWDGSDDPPTLADPNLYPLNWVWNGNENGNGN